MQYVWLVIAVWGLAALTGVWGCLATIVEEMHGKDPDDDEA